VHFKQIDLIGRLQTVHTNYGLEGWRQGDKIGRIFAYWVIVYFGSVLKITKSPHFWATFSTVKVTF
jgi:hypothetical protein